MKKTMFLILLILGFTFLNTRLVNSYGIKGGLCTTNQDFKYSESSFSLDGDIALYVEVDNPAKFLNEKVGFKNKYLEMRYIRGEK